MHNPLEPLLAEQGVVILDGAQGTELERRGIDIGGSKLWSAQLLIDDPDTVQAIHLDYLRSGSGAVYGRMDLYCTAWVCAGLP